jgi:hypothetical protein
MILYSASRRDRCDNFKVDILMTLLNSLPPECSGAVGRFQFSAAVEIYFS